MENSYSDDFLEFAGSIPGWERPDYYDQKTPLSKKIKSLRVVREAMAAQPEVMTPEIAKTFSVFVKVVAQGNLEYSPTQWFSFAPVKNSREPNGFRETYNQADFGEMCKCFALIAKILCMSDETDYKKNAAFDDLSDYLSKVSLFTPGKESMKLSSEDAAEVLAMLAVKPKQWHFNKLSDKQFDAIKSLMPIIGDVEVMEEACGIICARAKKTLSKPDRYEHRLCYGSRKARDDLDYAEHMLEGCKKAAAEQTVNPGEPTRGTEGLKAATGENSSVAGGPN